MLKPDQRRPPTWAGRFDAAIAVNVRYCRPKLRTRGCAASPYPEKEAYVSRQLVSSGSPFEPKIGFPRAVRVGSHLAVSGTAPIAPDGSVATPGDVYGQTRRCLEIAAAAIKQAGGRIEHVIRTRIFLTDITRWEDAARAHGEIFHAIRPATTFVGGASLINPAWLVEIEVDAVID